MKKLLRGLTLKAALALAAIVLGSMLLLPVPAAAREDIPAATLLLPFVADSVNFGADAMAVALVLDNSNQQQFSIDATATDVNVATQMAVNLATASVEVTHAAIFDDYAVSFTITMSTTHNKSRVGDVKKLV